MVELDQSEWSPPYDIIIWSPKIRLWYIKFILRRKTPSPYISEIMMRFKVRIYHSNTLRLKIGKCMSTPLPM